MPPWTNDKVTVVPAPIAGHDRAAELLYQSYENCSTNLDIHKPLTQQQENAVAEATMYNIMATQNHKEK